MNEFDQFLNDRVDYLALEPTTATNRDRIIYWLRPSLTHGCYQRRVYSSLDGIRDISFEGDLVVFAGKFSDTAGFQDQESAFWLFRIREELVHRHAFDSARLVHQILQQRRREGWFGRLLHALTYYYPRVAVALAIGYCSLLGAGSTREYFADIAFRRGQFAFPATLIAVLCVSLFFAFIEVQRRLGENRTGLIDRTRRLLGCGAFYAFVAGSVHVALKTWLHRGPSSEISWKYCALLAAMALAIGFAAQLFWHERAASDPL